MTACTVVQAVVKTNSQSNGKGQISTPCGSETPESISMKLGICRPNYVLGMTTHANPHGAATTWVVNSVFSIPFLAPRRVATLLVFQRLCDASNF